MQLLSYGIVFALILSSSSMEVEAKLRRAYITGRRVSVDFFHVVIIEWQMKVFLSRSTFLLKCRRFSKYWWSLNFLSLFLLETYAVSRYAWIAFQRCTDTILFQLNNTLRLSAIISICWKFIIKTVVLIMKHSFCPLRLTKVSAVILSRSPGDTMS